MQPELGDPAPEPTPQVSTVIPVRNGMPYLPATLDAALGQRGIAVEVVVRDNASDDGTAEYLRTIRDPRLRVITGTEPVGLRENFRLATEATNTEFVKLLCADDLITPDACARQAAVLADPEVALVASRRDVIDAAGRVSLPTRGLRGLTGRRTGQEMVRQVLLRGYNPIGEPGAAMFRRRDYDAVGGWSGPWIYPMDLHLWLRLLRRGMFVGQPESMASFRLSDASLSAARSVRQRQEHLAFTDQLAEEWQVPWWVRRTGRITGRLAWWSWTRRQRAILARAARDR